MLASTQQEAISVCASCGNRPDDIVCGLPKRPTPLVVATATQIGGGAVTPDTERPIIFLPRGQEPLVMVGRKFQWSVIPLQPLLAAPPHLQG